MIGKNISHYKILEKLGEGGMGEVYLADDLKLERKVALKFLPHHLTIDKENIERFEREAKAAAALNHPNIVTIYDIIETQEQICIVMEYIEGESLREKINKSELDLDKVLDITKHICEGLFKAHQAHIVHRDIKPENILIDNDGRVKILDFGLAKLKGVSKLTKETSTLGTIHYMSPEHIQGKEVDHRSDIWSLGVVLYEMLTGEPPFKGDYEQAILYSILNEDPKLLIPTILGTADYSFEIEQIINKALNKNPNDRYQRMEHMLDDLKSMQMAPQIRPPKSRFSKMTFKPFLIIFAIVLSLTLIIISYWLTRPKGEIIVRIQHTSPLTTAPGLEQDPSWSPDGTRLALTRRPEPDGWAQVYVNYLDGYGIKKLTTNPGPGGAMSPKWSPDASQIAYIVVGQGLFLMNADGSGHRQISSQTHEEVAWAPDGAHLVMSQLNLPIMVIDTDQSDREQQKP